MRKTIVLGITLLSFVLLVNLIPLVKAAFYWDGLRCVSIKYRHPDKDYYGISPYETEGIDGDMLHHCQIGQATSLTVIAAAELLCICMGEEIGGKVGTLVASALILVVTYVSAEYFLDEDNCIWFWVCRSFIEWLNENALDLLWKAIQNWAQVVGLILAMLIGTGYLQIGMIQFISNLGSFGGEVVPIDKVSLITPYVVLTLLVCVSSVVSGRKFGNRRKRD